ncbi:SIR2 family protein [Micrococcus antarcticus]
MENSNLDELLSLAFSLGSTPGSYAFVLGAGISIPSGVPSAWGVQIELLSRVARMKNETPDDLFTWYEDYFHKTPTYEDLLEHVGPTPHDRQSILRGFFEPSEEEREQGVKTPTLAHRSIAKLVSSGATRVILTLNFDRLMETALRDEGIEPVVISHPSDIEGLAPLHTLKALVVHLHGDYLSPTAMLNTKSELETYSRETEDLLNRILFDYGLIFVGWSATYDPALRQAIGSKSRRIYQPYWIEPGNLSAVAQDLRAQINAKQIVADADTALGWLSEGVESLVERKSRHPLTVPAAVSIAKRNLAGKVTAISLHDLIKREVDLLHAQEDLIASPSGRESQAGGYAGMVARLEESATVLASLIATAAYWGDSSTDRWWKEEIARLAVPSRGSGTTNVLRLPLVCSLQLFYAAGIAAVASGRNILARDLMLMMSSDPDRGSMPLSQVLDPEYVFDQTGAGKRLYSHLKPLFVQHLNVGAAKYDEAWESFEFLRLVEAISSQNSASEAIERVKHTKNLLRTANKELAEMRGTNNIDLVEAAEGALRRAKTNYENRAAEAAGLVPIYMPYVYVEYARNGWGHVPVLGRKLTEQVEHQRDQHPYVEAGFCQGDSNSLLAVIEIVTRRIGDIGARAARESMGYGGGIVPNYFRIGDL